ncbi:MAG TPA: helix-turn-helix transcriptional regulator [Acidimicrobiia bacterium]|nr:helix-turn-helix transcriptional regulator [Acidimicrobiia bacterium]
MSDFGGLIRDAREARGLSPHRVGELIGRASGTVKSWERGRTVPADPHVVTSLAAVLGLDEEALFRAAGLNPPDHKTALTIEQELATIAPRSAPADPARDVEIQFTRTPAGAPFGPPDLAPAGAALSHGVKTETETPSTETAQPEESVADAVTAFLQKGVDAIAEASAPVLEQFRKARKEKTRPAPRQIVSQQPVAPSGSYLDDPDEQWSYRLRSLWTAAGVGVLGMLLLWAGSRALDALGDTWEALLAGL